MCMATLPISNLVTRGDGVRVLDFSRKRELAGRGWGSGAGPHARGIGRFARAHCVTGEVPPHDSWKIGG